ncbi:prolyl oligopeptidase family serine peptidase [Catellatospora tritici]|uniref:prolyl oligopeptidase family serine peptidase n=1 Tax=Catellatospora tritici TaxID=2851566 RepID=UPI001C2CEB11|nr:prolyl oligopeptidase family serine peptidase [Catellatospora tritici]MBV1851639.1 prolyl oligopeptidase family serine peptidase [Catellatospora tritici]
MPHDPEDHEAAVPPVAPTEPREHELHGRRWTDEYGWMRDHDDPRFLAYLRAEREYHDAAASRYERTRTEVFHEVEQRLLPTDDSVSWRHGSRFYYTRTVTGSEYEQFLQAGHDGDSDRVLLDGALLAGSDGFAEIGLRELSPDNTLLAYSVDTTGDEVYRLRFRQLATLTDLSEELPRTYYTGAWSADSDTFFYTVHDELYRPHQVWRHTIGTPAADDMLVLQEDDARYSLTVQASRDLHWIMIESRSRDTSEWHLVPAHHPHAGPTVVVPRRRGVDYRVDHTDGHLIITTDDGAPEFRVVAAPVQAPDAGHWTELLAARPGERLVACHALRTHWLCELRRDGFPLLRAVDRGTGAELEIGSGLAAGGVTIATPIEYDDTSVTIRVESLIDPPAWYSVDLRTGARELRKRHGVPGYDPSAYRTERRHATAPDGTAVPVTLAWRADTPLDGTAPALLYGYGAYEACLDPEFDPVLPSLLDRGVIYALTHPRGGGENGRAWWQNGHLAAKTNTFTDHLAVADWLADGIADGTRLGTRGLSAGGLLQGAVYSMRPGRWAAVVAEVAFVDVVTTMLDPDIPLTVNEWDEWGDPRRAEEFEWLRTYSPYENPPVGPRPPLLATAALHDPRVMVHEPAKWIARLRATASPGDGPLYLRTELGAGAHTGPAGRYAHARYEAEIAAFLLTHLHTP